MSLRKRIERLEQERPEPVGELPPIILHWGEDETPEQRQEAARVRRLWEKAGVTLADAELVICWDDGTPAGAP